MQSAPSMERAGMNQEEEQDQDQEDTIKITESHEHPSKRAHVDDDYGVRTEEEQQEVNLLFTMLHSFVYFKAIASFHV